MSAGRSLEVGRRGMSVWYVCRKVGRWKVEGGKGKGREGKGKRGIIGSGLWLLASG